jgi:predicted transcriptional regulator
MRKNFTVINTDDSVQTIVREVSPEQAGVIPVIERDGSLAGIIEAHDLLKGFDRNPKVREIMRQDYVAARPDETVDEVTRDMVIHNVENIVVVEGNGLLKPIGVARAADILRLRRWVIEEEGFGNHPVRAKASLPPSPAPTPPR